jgi:iron(III) transport system substrate-binding protein
MTRWLRAGIALMLVAVIVACGGGDDGTEPRGSAPAAVGVAGVAPTSAARTQGKLVVYSALDQTTIDAMAAAFMKRNPDVDVLVLGIAAAGDQATRIKAERGAPRADIFIGGDTTFHEELANDGLLLAYKSPVAGQIDPRYSDAEGRFYGWYLGVLGIAINTNRFKDLHIAEPQTWDDLLDPAWRGKLAFPNPPTTGSGYIFLANQVFRFDKDEAKALEYMKKLDGNVGRYTQRSPDAVTVVAQGEFVGAMNWVHDILAQQQKGAPLKVVIPPDTAYEIGGVSIVKGGPNPETAKAFVDWVLGPEAGAINTDRSNRISVRDDVAAPAGAVKIADVALVNYDRDAATRERDRLLLARQQATAR